VISDRFLSAKLNGNLSLWSSMIALVFSC
jgi:hypothetical protein